MTPQKFRKRLEIVEAIRLTPETANDILDWLMEGGQAFQMEGLEAAIAIRTPEGMALCAPGAWMVRGEEGFFPLKHEVFMDYYEPMPYTEKGIDPV